MDDDVQQGHVVDASLAYLQKLEDEMRVLNGSPLGSSDSSNSSATMDSLSVARKRKRLGSLSEVEASKKNKIASAIQLPAELWHHIFSFLSPDILGRLLRVNRLFHKYLDPASPFIISNPVIHVPTIRILPTLSPDAIWRASRRLHWPTMPAPLKGRFELEMWRFACTRSCQLCDQLDHAYTTEDSSRRGQGNTTVSPIFSFFVNSCGNCLVEKSVKEVDFLLSTSTPSFLSRGLPMVFLSPDMSVISPQAMRSTPVSTTAQLTKVYWPPQVESLQAEFEEVKRFGAAAAEEWIKGLDSRGTEAIHDASRWDKWFLSGGVRQMRIRSSSATANKDFSSNIPNVDAGTSQFRRNPKRQAREEMEELKSKRRADIEARAAQLRPPILPGVLSNLQAFQTALGENTPLDDNEWKHLKPLLLAQRDKAEQIQQKHQNKIKVKSSEHQVRQDIEAVVRIHISNLADQAIRDRLVNGRSLTKENCAHFATEVLVYVRKQFYTSGAKAASLMRRLTLDDMRWIFDHKIGPHTNHHQKEFLLCRECPKRKRYGFQAIMQHYAMKHCSKKMKLMAIQWKAEWPEELPFMPSSAERKTTPRQEKDHSDLVPLGTQQSPMTANSEATDIVPAPVMHRYSDERFTYAGSNTSIDERFESHEALNEMTVQYIAREPLDWSDSTWRSAHLSSSVGPRYGEPEPRRHLETYYLHRGHAPYPGMESEREQRQAEIETRHTSRQSYITGYRQPVSSTTLYQPYDIVDVRNLHPHRIPTNTSYSNYNNRESHNNNAPASRVSNAYDSRNSLTNRRWWEGLE